jgi:sodium-dependent dicarboxylate transporter 2/3/5
MNSKLIGFFLGLILFIVILALPAFQTFQDSAHQFVTQNNLEIDYSTIASSMQSLLAVFVLMVIWWLTEAVPLPATALLPAILFPILKITGVNGVSQYEFTIKNTLLSYSNPVIYLFLGGFLLAGAMQKWKLDKRFTIWLLTRGKLAEDTRSILLGMMITTAFISMWISNTATAAMMLPLGLGVLTLMGTEPGKTKYGTGLMLGIAWSASIGGVGTIIGTPPNGIALGILNNTFGSDPAYNQITFIDWMKFGVPYVVLFIPVAWLV